MGFVVHGCGLDEFDFVVGVCGGAEGDFAVAYCGAFEEVRGVDAVVDYGGVFGAADYVVAADEGVEELEGGWVLSVNVFLWELWWLTQGGEAGGEIEVVWS